MEIIYLDNEQIVYFSEMIPNLPSLQSKKVFYVGAVKNNSPAGVCAYSIFGTQAQLCWIYVPPQYRRNKIGSSLIDCVKNTIENTNIDSIIFDTQIDAVAQLFFENAGFFIESEDSIYRIELSDIDEQKIFGKIDNSVIKGVHSLKNEYYFKSKSLRRMVQSHELGKNVLDENITCRECSFVCLDRNKEPDACVLTSVYGKDMCIDFMYSVSHNKFKLLYMLSFIFEYAKKNNIEGFFFFAANPKVLPLAERLSNNKVCAVKGNAYGVYVK